MRSRVKRWRPAVKRLGRVRQWVLHRVLWHEGESCDYCGGKVGLVWWADPLDWQRAYEHLTGVNRGSAGLLCPRCFTSAMRALGTLLVWHPIGEDRDDLDFTIYEPPAVPVGTQEEQT